jgi:hypothetical protein
MRIGIGTAIITAALTVGGGAAFVAAPSQAADNPKTQSYTTTCDTLRNVADRYDVSWRDLYTANRSKVSGFADTCLKPGIKLVIPSGTTEEPEQEQPQGGSNDVAEVQRVIDLVNAERRKAGVSPLKVSSCAGNAAQEWSEHMADTSNMEHRDNLSELMRDCGARSIGENIAYGQKSPESVMTAWMNSSGHRANILRSSYTHIGVGLEIDENGRRWWTQNFLTLS